MESSFNGLFTTRQVEEGLLPKHPRLSRFRLKDRLRWVLQIKNNRGFGALIKKIHAMLVQIAPDRAPFSFKNPLFIYAPPKEENVSRRDGSIHRDVDARSDGYISCFLYLNTVDDGSAGTQMWMDSTNVTIGKNTPRQLRNLQVHEIAPERGKLAIWDGRLVHRALPNNSSQGRMALSFLVEAKDVEPLDIEL